MPSGATTTVLYPKGCKFDMNYYLTSHMPLVKKHWGPAGLKSYKVIQFPDDADYSVQATLEWGSKAEFDKAAGGEHTAEIMGDVPNFSDGKPILITGEVTGSD
ncbi:hypothetical protein LTR95_009071 [Oleoguttula sp. CCFEE 5521]|uniref:EthD domain-containing protein n=1 Tax=Cryoendolithus antarcticus TaxID=1507870 RepID=A0A1V8SAH3_9PEZI|nr:hypothetical protein B0A48_18070 [Cryoendolithus antarcticus]OQO24184.1 hypothetical protein B0A51_07822 [Rachicladosporium sp. CCFEE 5018]OQO25057.1 hypothetical protein B0A51_07436 [Rachicladosporium sp. CCFEE 5018]